jgi:hypothetical protein
VFDDVYEPNETFVVNAGSVTNATIADGQGLGTINNDDNPPLLSIDSVSQMEGNAGTTTFIFTVTLSGPSYETITVDFSTADGGATAGLDYQATSGTLTFAPGETTKTIVVIVYGDTIDEPEGAAGFGEDFFVNLSNAVNGTIDIGQGVGLIEDDD